MSYNIVINSDKLIEFIMAFNDGDENIKNLLHISEPCEKAVLVALKAVYQKGKIAGIREAIDVVKEGTNFDVVHD